MGLVGGGTDCVAHAAAGMRRAGAGVKDRAALGTHERAYPLNALHGEMRERPLQFKTKSENALPINERPKGILGAGKVTH
jgi:hypothetical protein